VNLPFTPHLQTGVSPLNPSPLLNPHQGRKPLLAMAAGVPPPLPTRTYISAPRASLHPPSVVPELSYLPRPRTRLAIDWSSGRHAIAAARAFPPSVKHL
jgi:hypothetical protein